MLPCSWYVYILCANLFTPNANNGHHRHSFLFHSSAYPCNSNLTSYIPTKLFYNTWMLSPHLIHYSFCMYHTVYIPFYFCMYHIYAILFLFVSCTFATGMLAETCMNSSAMFLIPSPPFLPPLLSLSGRLRHMEVLLKVSSSKQEVVLCPCRLCAVQALGSVRLLETVLLFLYT